MADFNPQQFYRSLPLQEPHNAFGDTLAGTGLGAGLGAGAGALIPFLFSKLTNIPLPAGVTPQLGALLGGTVGGGIGTGIGLGTGINKALQVGEHNGDITRQAAQQLSPKDMASLYEYLLYTPYNQL